MSIIAVNPASVKALRDYSRKLEEGVEEIKSSTCNMQNITDQYQGSLGPHAGQIRDALDAIQGAVWQGVQPVNEISEKLIDVADAYQDVIDTDYYGGSGK